MTRCICWAVFMLGISLINFGLPGSAEAVFILTDKLDANPMAIPDGNTASTVYVMETSDEPTAPSVPHASRKGFRFTAKDGSGDLLTTASAGETTGADRGHLQGYDQSLAGNESNGYVGTNLEKAFGNSVTLGFGAKLLVNGPGADLYITEKDLNGSDLLQATSTNEKSFSIAFHFVDDGGSGTFDDTWHLYNAAALPTNFQPEDTGGGLTSADNVLGALDLSDLMLVGGDPISDGSITGSESKIPLGATIDQMILVNNNSQNANAFGFWGAADPSPESKSPGNYFIRRDFDNADLDNDPFTGMDFLTGRYGTRPFNGQDGNQAWLVGLINVEGGSSQSGTVPEPSTGLLLLVGILTLSPRRRRCGNWAGNQVRKMAI